MKDIIKNEKGAIFLVSVALVVALVSVASTLSLVALVRTDHFHTQFQHDTIQEELLLRSESKRTLLSVEYNEIRPIPDRTVEILTDNRRTIYTINNTSQLTTIDNYLGWATAQALAINSLISAKRGSRFGNNNSNNDKYYYRLNSPIKRYSEKLLRNESLAQYQYFSNFESSENADGGDEAARVKFWGPDELHGKVHSNDDIWVQQAGGGINNDWPTFHKLVTTAGGFKYYPTGQPLETVAPMDDIFLDGWEEDVPPIVYDPNADDIRANGVRPFPPDIDIVYVKLNGSGFESMIATVDRQGDKELDVYSWFPTNANMANAVIAAGGNWFEDSDNVWTNHIPEYDTTWTTGPPAYLANQSVWVDCELWIEGEVSGKITFGCADTVYIVGDITYTNTEYLEPPDGDDNPNLIDYFGLVSEEKLLIRYKHRDPFADMVVRTDNCTDIALYGAFAAIGKGDLQLYGDLACHYDGIFTFEYQHPHGSTPSFNALSPYTGQDTLYKYVDLQRFIYPPNAFVPPDVDGFVMHGSVPTLLNVCGYPIESSFALDPNGHAASYPNNGPNYVYPNGTDYPWYNPIWPESQQTIVYERGVIHMWGAIAQRRRGFVHRSGIDPYNHPQGNQSPSPWNMDQYHYDGFHPSTGYDKDYHYDQRFMFVQPPDYPEIYRGFGESTLSAFQEDNWVFKVPQ